jgi:S-methylmethionine-dependent homocysteine/selenocysteine methylase
MYDLVRAKLKQGQPVLLDGPMGSELVRRGIRWRKHGMLSDAPAVQQLHEEYLAAGADVIRTNTLQLNPRLYLNVFRGPDHMRQIGAPGLETMAQRLYRTAAYLAKYARTKSGRAKNAAIAGVLSPLNHCYRPDMAPPPDQARKEHEALARILAEEGVDFILLESMNTVREAKAALEAARAANLPVWASFVLGPEGDVLGGDSLADAAKAMEQGGAEAVLVNCAPPEDVTRAVEKLKKATSLPVGAFALVGHFSPPSWKFDFHPQFVDTGEWPPDRYAAEARRWRDGGAAIIGSCCGTGPVHTAALRGLLGRNGGRS